MSDEHFCMECGGMIHGDKKISCICGDTVTYTEQERDEFAMSLLKWVNDNFDGLESGGWTPGDGYPTYTDQQILEQFKKTL